MVGGNYGGQYCLLLGTHTYTLHPNYYKLNSDREFVPAFKLKPASTFVLARREVNPIEFPVVCYTNIPKDCGEAKQNCQEMQAFQY